MLQVSNDTLLRSVRRHGKAPLIPPDVIGIDDWVWRRNQRYGTIICDLEQRKPIALLPDREPATAQAWLTGRPQISIVARDRGGRYALAQLEAQRKTLRAKLGEREWAKDTRRKVLLGAFVLYRLERGQDEFSRHLGDWLRKELVGFLTREDDKALFSDLVQPSATAKPENVKAGA